MKQRLVQATSAEGDWRAALLRHPRDPCGLLQPLAASEHAGSGSALPCSSADIAQAAAFGGALEDMILQLNAVRLWVAESQLAQVRATVAGSQQAVVVADTAQHSCYSNGAFYALGGCNPGAFSGLQDLAALFTEPGRALQMLGQVVPNSGHGALNWRCAAPTAAACRWRCGPSPRRCVTTRCWASSSSSSSTTCAPPGRPQPHASNCKPRWPWPAAPRSRQT